MSINEQLASPACEPDVRNDVGKGCDRGTDGALTGGHDRQPGSRGRIARIRRGRRQQCAVAVPIAIALSASTAHASITVPLSRVGAAGQDATGTRADDVLVGKQVGNDKSLHDGSMGACTNSCTTDPTRADAVQSLSYQVAAEQSTGNDWSEALGLKNRWKDDEQKENVIEMAPPPKEPDPKSDAIVIKKKWKDDTQVKQVINPQEPCKDLDPNAQVPRSALVMAISEGFRRRALLGAKRAFQPTSFHCVRPPPMSLRDYLIRLSTYFQCSDEALLLGVVYVDRVMKMRPEVVFNGLSMHRLIVTSTMVAAKFHDDTFYSNKHYAKVGGVSPEELCKLERHFMHLIGWRLNVSPEEYAEYQRFVQRAVQCMNVSFPMTGEPSELQKLALQRRPSSAQPQCEV